MVSRVVGVEAPLRSREGRKACSEPLEGVVVTPEGTGETTEEYTPWGASPLRTTVS
jgi:hypothetical protein